MHSADSHYDIIFLGGGLASNLIARYLQKKYPDFKILVLEKNIKAHHNPGESTVGVTGLFMIRELGLSTYCYLNHLPKNGFRFFFRDPQKSFDLSACSEIGSSILPVFPTYQLDRARLDEDLWDLNRELGVDVITGAEVQEVVVNEDSKPHELTYSKDTKTHQVKCDWILNASGRGSRAAPVFDQMNPVKDDTDMHTAAAWGRFKNIADIDSMGDESWRARVGHTSRYLSTNHIMGHGYWIWVIPIDRGLVSFGLVYDKNVVGKIISTQDQFLDFVRSEPLVEKILEGSQQVDFQSHSKLSFRRDRFCSKDRWVMLGDSMGFIDPLYSPGSDIIARQAYLLEHLLNSKSDEELNDVSSILNDYTRYEYNLLKLLYAGQYAGFESFEVYNIKSLWDFHSYTNRMVWNFLNRNFSDLNWVKREVETAQRSLELTKVIQDGFQELYQYLKENKLESRMNLNLHSFRQNRFKIEEEMLVEYSNDRSVEEHLFLCRLTISELIESRYNIPDFREHKLSQDMLTFASLSSFKLTDKWFKKLLDRVARRLSLMIRQKTNQTVNVKLTAKDYRKSLPECLSSADRVVKQEATKIWCDSGSNPVLEKLYETVEKRWVGPSWKT
tara:strand:- start:5330 stop:7171 length:1842 start_codon:yes stop_codon:yes gene_type:complete